MVKNVKQYLRITISIALKMYMAEYTLQSKASKFIL